MSLISFRTLPLNTADGRLRCNTSLLRRPNRPQYLSPPPLFPPNHSTSYNTRTHTRILPSLRPLHKPRIPLSPAHTTHPTPLFGRTLPRCSVSPRVRLHRSSPPPSIPPPPWLACNTHLPPHLTCTLPLPGVLLQHRVRGPPLSQCPIWGQAHRHTIRERPTTSNLLLKSNRLCPAQVCVLPSHCPLWMGADHNFLLARSPSLPRLRVFFF